MKNIAPILFAVALNVALFGLAITKARGQSVTLETVPHLTDVVVPASDTLPLDPAPVISASRSHSLGLSITPSSRW